VRGRALDATGYRTAVAIAGAVRASADVAPGSNGSGGAFARIPGLARQARRRRYANLRQLRLAIELRDLELGYAADNREKVSNVVEKRLDDRRRRQSRKRGDPS